MPSGLATRTLFLLSPHQCFFHLCGSTQLNVCRMKCWLNPLDLGPADFIYTLHRHSRFTCFACCMFRSALHALYFTSKFVARFWFEQFWLVPFFESPPSHSVFCHPDFWSVRLFAATICSGFGAPIEWHIIQMRRLARPLRLDRHVFHAGPLAHQAVPGLHAAFGRLCNFELPRPRFGLSIRLIAIGMWNLRSLYCSLPNVACSAAWDIDKQHVATRTCIHRYVCVSLGCKR